MNHEAIKSKIIDEMRVLPEINVESEIRQRLDFIKNTLVGSGLKALVLGISGGIDSTSLGKLTQVAIDELNQENSSTDPRSKFSFIAIRLPYGTQSDEQDAQMALDFISPSVKLCINIK